MTGPEGSEASLARRLPKARRTGDRCPTGEENRGLQQIGRTFPQSSESLSGYPGEAGVSGNAASLLEERMYYVRWADPFGKFWRGPFRREHAVDMAARGAVSLNVAVDGPHGPKAVSSAEPFARNVLRQRRFRLAHEPASGRKLF